MVNISRTSTLRLFWQLYRYVTLRNTYIYSTEHIVLRALHQLLRLAVQSTDPSRRKDYSEGLEAGVVQQNKDVIRLAQQCAENSEFAVFVEDDFKPCPHALARVIQTLQVCIGNCIL